MAEDPRRWDERDALLVAAVVGADLYVWDASRAVFVSMRTGETITREFLLQVVEQRIALGFDVLLNQVEPMLAGQIEVRVWQDAMAVELRRAHTQMMALGRGGWGNVTSQDWARVERKLLDEYNYLRNFAEQIANGELSAAQIRYRIGLYENGIYSSYWKGADVAQEEAGYTEEARFRTAAESCGDCVEYEARGWVPIGTLPAPGEASQCGHNCRCIKEYR